MTRHPSTPLSSSLLALTMLAAPACMLGPGKQVKIKNGSTLKVCHTEIGKPDQELTREPISDIEPGGERTYTLNKGDTPEDSTYLLRFYTCDQTLLAEKTLVAGQDTSIIVP